MSVSYSFIELLNKERLKKADYDPEKWALFIGLNIDGMSDLAIDGGESPSDFHVTLCYGYFTPRSDEDDAICRVQKAIESIKDDIPDELWFDAIRRFDATDSSDGKDVIYAQVEKGQLEDVHEHLLTALKDNGIEIEKTFPDYTPHMTLAYIDSSQDHKLQDISKIGTVTDILYSIKSEDYKDNRKIPF